MAERVDVGAIRRVQIVEAASRVIARKGFHNATLAEVETEAGISRGMMTYHFPTKDAMILAVFDSLIDRLRLSSSNAAVHSSLSGRERIERRIEAILARPSHDEEDQSLLYAFLAQMAHRETYRSRLAGLFADVRDDIAADFRDFGCQGDPHELATLLVAAFQGILLQIFTDPAGLDASRLARSLKAIFNGVFVAVENSQTIESNVRPFGL